MPKNAEPKPDKVNLVQGLVAVLKPRVCYDVGGVACIVPGVSASQYIDPDEMDFEGQEWLMPENAEPKPEKVIQELRRGLKTLLRAAWSVR
jgi:hypothetical protein